MLDGSRTDTGSFFRLEKTEKRNILILAVIAAILVTYTLLGDRLLYMTGMSGPPLAGTYRTQGLVLALFDSGNLASTTKVSSIAGTWRVLDAERFAWQPNDSILPPQSCRYRFIDFNNLRIDDCGFSGTYVRTE